MKCLFFCSRCEEHWRLYPESRSAGNSQDVPSNLAPVLPAAPSASSLYPHATPPTTAASATGSQDQG